VFEAEGRKTAALTEAEEVPEKVIDDETDGTID
jgi:hypothetical protein